MTPVARLALFPVLWDASRMSMNHRIASELFLDIFGHYVPLVYS